MITQTHKLGQIAYYATSLLWRVNVHPNVGRSRIVDALCVMSGQLFSGLPQQDIRVNTANDSRLALAADAFAGGNPNDARIRCWSHGRRRPLAPDDGA